MDCVLGSRGFFESRLISDRSRVALNALLRPAETLKIQQLAFRDARENAQILCNFSCGKHFIMWCG
jgi:hypothetical protein